NFYLFVLERNAQSLLYGTYFGGNQSSEHVDGGTSRFDKNGIVYQSVCAGCWGNQDFPTTAGAWSSANNSSGCNNGVFKFDFEIIPKAKFTVDNFEGCAPLTVTFSNTSNNSDTYLWDFGAGDTTSQIFNPIKTYNTPGVYNVSLLITDSICNTIDTAFQTITIEPSISLNGGNTVTICEDTLTLFINSTGGPSSFVWSSNNQFTDTLNTNPIDSTLFITLSDTNTFYVMASNSLCSEIDSFIVNYAGYEIQTANNIICEGDQMTLNLTNLSNTRLSYNWTPTNTIISGANTINPIVNPIITTTYYVTTQNSFGCIVNDSTTITVVPEVSISGGTTFTTCDTATLTIITTGNPVTIIWSSNNQFTDTLALNTNYLLAAPTDTSWYYVFATNGPCNATDSFLVNYPGFSIQTVNGAICSGNNDTLGITTQSLQNLTYNWTPTANIVSGSNTANPIVNPTITTTYYVTVQNNFGCIINDTVIVNVSGFNASNITIWADKDSLYAGESTQLHVAPNIGFTYQWIPPFNLNNATIPNPTTTPTPPSVTTYTVLLTENSSGCEFLKKITIYAFEVNCGEPDVFLPNAFTPNGDNENDMLFVRGKIVEKMILKIYDRWGELVFETDKQSNGWDGTYKGNLVDPGVFVYYLEVTCVDGQEYFKKGNITVIR
ncbi:MAG: gliding motility-associated C-terminal domain-containing protein, partial [Flavobacteriales bacterium]|nr:gliding motility-associated C-terminal domain-containing protein [Flavobacteriales bacterium]